MCLQGMEKVYGEKQVIVNGKSREQVAGMSSWSRVEAYVNKVEIQM